MPRRPSPGVRIGFDFFTTSVLTSALFALLGVVSCGGGGGNGGNGGGQSGTPALSATVATQGNFSANEQNAAYTIQVANSGNAATSAATPVMVVDPDTGFTPTAMSGSNWTCTVSTLTCTYSASVGAGQNFPLITVTGNVTASNGSSVIIALSLSGGGIASTVPVNPPATPVAAPVLSIGSSHTGNFNLGQQGASYTVTVKNGASAGDTNGTVTVTEDLSQAPGLTLASMSGAGWSCVLPSCSRSDHLATGQSYPITVTVNVAANAASSQTASASVSGGGSTTPAPATDPTTINMPDLSIVKSHTGTFTAGANGTFTIAVSNVAAGATAGPTGSAITVTDVLASQFTYVSATATGWSCGASGQTVTCTSAGPINAGASATTIPLVVAVSPSATGTISNTATVATFGDSNSANNSSTHSVTLGAASPPDIMIVNSIAGNYFNAGLNGTFNLIVSNVGAGPTTGLVTVTDVLGSQFAFISAGASGWNCNASGQTVTCTNPGPIAPSTFAATINLAVAVSSSASGNISNTATIATAGDANASNNSSTYTVNVVAATPGPPDVSILAPGDGVFAGGSAMSLPISVTNDQAGDVLTPSLGLVAGGACSAATCGTIGSVTGSSGNYSLTYTPPASAGFNSTISIAVTVTSSLPSSFAAIATFPVHPSGQRIVSISSVPILNQEAGSPINYGLTVIIYNDTGASTGANINLLASGYACPSNGSGGTMCGTLGVSSPLSGTTSDTISIPYTLTSFSYKPPASVPGPPYDRPMVLAVSKTDPNTRGEYGFTILASNGALPRDLDTVPSGGPGIPLRYVAADPGTSKTVTWTLESSTGGVNAPCQPACGSLSPTVYQRNGQTLISTVTYAPPATFPSQPPDAFPQVFETVDDDSSLPEGITNFQVIEGTCGTGNNGVLNGQYTYLTQGGGENAGYATSIGSFTADGNGNITAGLRDFSNSNGAGSAAPIATANSSYSIGSDNRGCLTISDTDGTSITYRISVGTLDGSSHATQGSMIRFDDYTGTGVRAQGVLMKQDPTSFANSAVSGNYVFGEQGVDGSGGRIASAGVYTADGNGNLSNFERDVNDNGVLDTNDTLGSGTYSIDTTTGRGTATFTSGGVPKNSVLYMVNSSEFLSMTSDPLTQTTSILAGENHKQTTTTFTATSLDHNGYVSYVLGRDPANGGNDIQLSQEQFTTNGNATLTLDENDNGTLDGGSGGVAASIPITLSIAANGRAVVSGVGNPQPVIYLIGTNFAVYLDGDSRVGFGYIQQQIGGPFSNASLSGRFFFGASAPVLGGSFDGGSVSLNGGGTLTGTDDSVSEANGLQSSTAITGVSYSFSSTSSPVHPPS